MAMNIFKMHHWTDYKQYLYFLINDFALWADKKNWGSISELLYDFITAAN